MKITFIGMGLMGIPMAKNILKNGFDLTVYNRTSGKTWELISLGAHESSDLIESIRNADVVITMVTAWEDVVSIISQVRDFLRKDSVFIDMSTIGVKWAKYIAHDLHEVWVHFLDAPVTGSTPKAITGELTIFIGWEKLIFERVQDIFSAMWTNLQYIWEVGMGQAMKLVNNTLVAYTMIGLAEVMKLAEGMHMNLDRTAEVIKTIPVASAYTNMKIDNFVSHTYPLMFSVANMNKDIRLAYDMMKDSGLSLEYLIHAKWLFESAVWEGIWWEDLSAIEKLI